MNNVPIPNCIMIGAAKAGTTYMFNLLSQHPEICRSKKKELTFFSSDGNYHNNSDFLLDQYSSYDGEKIILDNTPEYLLKSYCAKRIFEFSGPNAKLICMVRQPAQRAFSHFLMNRIIGREDDDFSTAVRDEINGNKRGRPTYMPFKRVPRDFVKRGLYIDSLNDFLKYYKKENIHIVVFEEFIENPEKELKRLLAFIGLNSDYEFNMNTPKNPGVNARTTILTKPVHAAVYLLKKYGINISHKTNYRLRKLTSRPLKGPPEKISPEDFKFLTDYYMDSISGLEKQFSLDLSTWKNPRP